MARKSGATRVKRAKVPGFWEVPRKKLRFIYRVKPGPHPKDKSYPLAVLLRDVLKLVRTAREAEAVIKEGQIKVDGDVRRDPRFPVGLMDSVGIDSIKAYYRILPREYDGLTTVEISQEDCLVKPLAVKKKTTLRGNVTQIGFHDGRTMIFPSGRGEVNVGDTLLVNLGTKEIMKILPLKKGALALLVKGAYGGTVGRVQKVNMGTITTPSSVEIEFDSRRVIVPKDSVFVIGDKSPLIPIPELAKVTA